MPCVVTGRAIVGVLHSAGTCVWMTMENGVDVVAYWPAGYSASFGILRVYDASGSLVASEGEQITAVGNDPYHGDPDQCGRTTYVILGEPIVNGP